MTDVLIWLLKLARSWLDVAIGMLDLANALDVLGRSLQWADLDKHVLEAIDRERQLQEFHAGVREALGKRVPSDSMVNREVIVKAVGPYTTRKTGGSCD